MKDKLKLFALFFITSFWVFGSIELYCWCFDIAFGVNGFIESFIFFLYLTISFAVLFFIFAFILGIYDYYRKMV